jgi:D-sedoheptulose 7-phosphate isomerase
MMTRIANDFGFDEIFSRQVEGLGKPGDVLVAFSTSGNSPDVTYAVTQAKAMGIATVALVGKINQGGRLACISDVVVNIDSDVASCIQEVHQICVHLIMEEIEKAME